MFDAPCPCYTNTVHSVSCKYDRSSMISSIGCVPLPVTVGNILFSRTKGLQPQPNHHPLGPGCLCRIPKIYCVSTASRRMFLPIWETYRQSHPDPPSGRVEVASIQERLIRRRNRVAPPLDLEAKSGRCRHQLGLDVNFTERTRRSLMEER